MYLFDNLISSFIESSNVANCIQTLMFDIQGGIEVELQLTASRFTFIRH